MNFLINRLDNLDIGSKSFEFIPENIKKDINMDGWNDCWCKWSVFG